MKSENGSTKICRLCLKSADSFESINSDGSLYNKIDTLFKLNVERNDTFTQIICSDCSSLVNQFWDFYQIVISNQVILEASQPSELPQVEVQDTIIKQAKPKPVQKRKPDKINDQLPDHLKIRKTRGTCDAKIKEFIKLNCTLCSNQESADHVTEFDNFKSVEEHFATVHKCRGFVECCERRFYRKDRLMDHIIIHTDPSAFKCPQCGQKCKNKILLKSHMKQHLPLDEWKFQCNQCSARFALKSQLSNHEATHFTESQKKYVCDECGKSFALQFVMLKHKERHSTERNYVCDICARTFISKASLQCHIAKHNAPDTRNIRVQCKICQSWYKNRNTLRTHMHHHRDKREHRCEVCQKLCATKSALAAHIRYVHLNLHEFECTICDRKFRRKLELTEHMARHSGKPLYQCKICSTTFTSSSSYFSHRKKRHSQENSKVQSLFRTTKVVTLTQTTKSVTKPSIEAVEEQEMEEITEYLDINSAQYEALDLSTIKTNLQTPPESSHSLSTSQPRLRPCTSRKSALEALQEETLHSKIELNKAKTKCYK